MAHVLSEALAAAVKAASESVVRVETRHGRAGTGLAWAADLVVTNARTVGRSESVTIGLPDGRDVAGTVTGRDFAIDLAVIRVEGGGLTPAATDGDPAVEVGHIVVPLGRPGKTIRAAFGLVAAVGPGWRTHGGAEISRHIDVDGSLPPGFPGGPLVDLDGKILGINSRVLLRGGGTVPIADVRKAVERLARGGGRRGHLGVAAHPVDLGDAIAAKVGQKTGLLVVSVEAGGPADKAGLLLGDVIVGVDGATVGSLEDLVGKLHSLGAGKDASLRIVRAGEPKDVAVKTG